MALAQGLEAALARQWWRPRPNLLAWLLLPLALLFALVANLRRALYRAGWLNTVSAPVPVLVVGNLVVGGAGKSPTVIALVAALRAAGHVPGVVSRGHGRRGGASISARDADARSVGDEPLLIARRTGAPVWVARRRIEAARALCAAHPEVDLIIADDGLQHLALARDVQLVVFDERGTGNGLLLPAGPLREPLSPHVPVNTHVLYNATRASTPWPGGLAQRRLTGAVALQDWWQGAGATRETLNSLRGRPLLAVAGLAAPQRFFDMLRDAQLQFTPLPLQDHHAFDPLPWPADTADVVLTEKDAIKLPRTGCGATRVWVVPLDFRLPDALVADLLENLRLLRPPSRP